MNNNCLGPRTAFAIGVMFGIAIMAVAFVLFAIEGATP
jgi:hypothetical protein